MFIIISCALSCENKKTTLVWEKNFPLIGSQSSPRATDLNNDGVKDLVIGAGEAELDATPYGVLALDGSTGESLWTVNTQAQIVGSASFIDITDDGTKDVFIGGRNQVFKSINGHTGELIWQYANDKIDDPILQHARFNFYNSSIIDDVNNNGYPELLTINGGNWDALPNEDAERYPAVLMLIDAKDGNVIAADTMPDGRESYMSPVAFKQKNSPILNILIGTGGETMGGSLFLTSLQDLLDNKLEASKVIFTNDKHGIIAPPALADINDDGFLDILVASHNAQIKAIDGSSYKLIWQHRFEGYECSSSFAIGQFTDDEIPDVFTIVSNGVWPDYSHGLHVMINGASGDIAYKESLGCYSLTTPVAYDLTRDGIDEIIMSINDYDCDIKLIDEAKRVEKISNLIVALDLTKGVVQEIDRSPRFRNTFGSPWIGELDSDGYLDIVYAQNFSPDDLFKIGGMRIKRISSSIKMQSEDVAWGEYMGAEGKGIYIKR